jgi:hypothetical protein
MAQQNAAVKIRERIGRQSAPRIERATDLAACRRTQGSPLEKVIDKFQCLRFKIAMRQKQLRDSSYLHRR